jgi:N-acetylglucosaminyl-diphospho-decaprenol L-rhamnosyltransferase
LSRFANLSLVIVNYNSATVIEDCLESVEATAAIIVVDNASRDDSVERIRRICPDAEIILNEENWGFGTAVNQGFAQVKTPYALLINPDAVLRPQAVESLIATAQSCENTGIVAPLLYSPKRGLELELKGPGERGLKRMGITPGGDFCTWFATGAVWLCNMTAWRDVGGFDETIFLYGEDLDLCRRMTNKGYTILLCPKARGEHLVSQATASSRKIRWRKEWNIVWSHLYLTEKYDGSATAEAWRLVCKHGPKTLFYALVIQPKRFMRDLAVSHAALSFLIGGKPKRGL